MEQSIIEEVAKELDLSTDEVAKVIKSIEDKVLQNIRRSNYDNVYSTRIMGFGTFGPLPEKIIERLKKRSDDKTRTKISSNES